MPPPFEDREDRSLVSPLEGGAAKQRGVYASAYAQNLHPPALQAFPPRRGDPRLLSPSSLRGGDGENRPGGVVFRFLRASVENPVAQSSVCAIVMSARQVGL